MGKFLYKSFYLYAIWPRWLMVVPLWFAVNTSVGHSPTELSGAATKLFITSEGFLIFDALKIITRSLYNCRVFVYYGGIQKLTALMKGHT